MEFFDDVINKTRDAIDVAYKKTNEVVSIQRQKFDIAAMESKLANDYQNLGRVCFDIINDEKEITAEAKMLVKEIAKKQAEIEDARAKVSRAQGKKFCPKCGIANVSEAHFCFACGESFIEEN